MERDRGRLVERRVEDLEEAVALLPAPDPRERLEVVSEFPLSPFGKVSKKTLTEEIAAKLAAEGA